MLSFQYIRDFVQNAEKLYESAQSEKDDIKKQAMTTMVYDLLVSEFKDCVKVCEDMKQVHRESGCRLLKDKLNKLATSPK